MITHVATHHHVSLASICVFVCALYLPGATGNRPASDSPPPSRFGWIVCGCVRAPSRPVVGSFIGCLLRVHIDTSSKKSTAAATLYDTGTYSRFLPIEEVAPRHPFKMATRPVQPRTPVPTDLSIGRSRPRLPSHTRPIFLLPSAPFQAPTISTPFPSPNYLGRSAS